MADCASDGKSLKHIVLFLFPGVKPEPPDDFRFIGRVVRQDPLAIECPQPVLHDTASKITANRCSRATVCGGCGGVQERRQRSLDEIYVGYTRHKFLGERLLVLADLEYEGGIGLDVEVEITQGDAIGGGSVDQNCIVVVRSDGSLKAEAGASDEKGVGRSAIPTVGAVVTLEVSVRLNLVLIVGTFHKKVFAVPTRNDRDIALFFRGFFLGGLLCGLGPLSGFWRFRRSY